MANITEIDRKAKIVGMTTTVIGLTGDLKLAGGIRNLYDKMHTQDLWSTNTLKKNSVLQKVAFLFVYHINLARSILYIKYDVLILQYTNKKLPNIQGDYFKCA